MVFDLVVAAASTVNCPNPKVWTEVMSVFLPYDMSKQMKLHQSNTHSLY